MVADLKLFPSLPLNFFLISSCLPISFLHIDRQGTEIVEDLKIFFSLSYHTEKVEEDMSEKQLGIIVPLT